jgi:hypothetical protein
MSMPEPMYSVFQVLHPGGAFLAFAAAPLALLAIKGSRWHILAGRVFTIGMAVGAGAGVLLAVYREEPAISLLLLGLLALFFTGSGYLAPRIGRGSRASYRWDRALTVVGIIASVLLIGRDLPRTTLQAPVQEGVVATGAPHDSPRGIYGGLVVHLRAVHQDAASGRTVVDPHRLRPRRYPVVPPAIRGPAGDSGSGRRPAADCLTHA